MSELLENENKETEIKETEIKETESESTDNKIVDKNEFKDDVGNEKIDKNEKRKKDKDNKNEKDKKIIKKKKGIDGKNDNETKKTERKPEDINIVKDLLWLVVYIGMVILICFLIIKFVGCRSRVDGSSMNPTLADGDNLWVDKLSYTFGKPKRFDVIIFNPNGNEKITYVKRIIGLPGETVTMDIEGKIYINGQLLNENYALEEPFLVQRLGILSGDNEIVLGEDEYFVLGDNRNNSMDSRRSDPGNVKKEYIIGKVVLRIYPFSKFGFID